MELCVSYDCFIREYLVSIEISGVSTVVSSGACAPLTSSLLILNKYIGYHYYTHTHNLEMVAMLCSHKALFHAGCLPLIV